LDFATWIAPNDIGMSGRWVSHCRYRYFIDFIERVLSYGNLQLTLERCSVRKGPRYELGHPLSLASNETNIPWRSYIARRAMLDAVGRRGHIFLLQQFADRLDRKRANIDLYNCLCQSHG
jgi:hypothetical protein